MTAISINKICGPHESLMDVVLLHGLTGNQSDTWTSRNCAEENDYWPEWLSADCEGVSVYAIDYDSSFFRAWADEKLNIHELATSSLELLASEGIGKRPLIIVAHSLGGILAKEILRVASNSSDPDWLDVAKGTRLVCFIGTPHGGVALAGVINTLLPGAGSKNLVLLSGDSGYLAALRTAYRDYAAKYEPITLAYYEKQKTKGVHLVDQNSADPGVTGTTPIGVEADHVSLCRPSSRASMLYRSLLLRMRRLLKPLHDAQLANKTPLHSLDFSAADANDRRDLLAKLIDAGRELEYPIANRRQNRFAIEYMRDGLHPTFKRAFDAFLSAIEQRFITHVYLEKICKHASTSEIAAALQVHVIDAVRENAPKEWNATEGSILDALYFLTERCHIRWDVP